MQHVTTERATGTIQTINGSHTGFIARPRTVARFLSEALAAL